MIALKLDTTGTLVFFISASTAACVLLRLRPKMPSTASRSVCFLALATARSARSPSSSSTSVTLPPPTPPLALSNLM